MKRSRFKTVFAGFFITLLALYGLAAWTVSQKERNSLPDITATQTPLRVAIFGASGTAGSGILKAALASDNIEKIIVVTRHDTPFIASSITSEKVERVFHKDYLDYTALKKKLVDLDAVYWAIGISSLGADEQTYAKIHVDFPLEFVKTWLSASTSSDISFHFISSSDISEESETMWIKQKIRSEKTLIGFANETRLRVIAYRPDYIGAISEQSSLLQSVLYGFFRPVGAAVKAVEIGQAMIDVSLRGTSVENGYKLTTRQIIEHSGENNH